MALPHKNQQGRIARKRHAGEPFDNAGVARQKFPRKTASMSSCRSQSIPLLGATLMILLTADMPGSAGEKPAPSEPIPAALQPYPSQFASPPVEYRLWESGAPGAPESQHKGWDVGNGCLKMWGIPSIVVWEPLQAGQNRGAVIICPGGAYQVLSTDWRNHIDGLLQDGYVVFMLKYRTVPDWKEVEKGALLDAKRAVRFVRHHAGAWGVDPGRIGVVGASAGAHLTLNLLSHPDEGNPSDPDPVEREACRPAFVGLLCPWPTPDSRPASAYPVNADSPPAFIASARDDTGAPPAFAVAIASEYEKAGAPHFLWQIDSGGHLAFHSRNTEGEGFQWRAKFTEWLQKILPPQGTPRSGA